MGSSAASLRTAGKLKPAHTAGGIAATTGQAARRSRTQNHCRRAAFSGDQKNEFERQKRVLESYCSRQGRAFDVITSSIAQEPKVA
jgi:hypothetical protein